ncbi:hypothetical protein MNQ95_04540 [Pseudoxanthomonas daejeonensis]|uniref:hypothetical protein n=1 Tax=Pseudoxanthomonas daejeonensis TaxID=266062 RepID=UPI001F546C48|nr:hypothetical protein [Pseudoxanthomonas daejeonensis]UNK58373.1 hypothetical protein MNQ95_04540 [Pseudoxanthomonas daejeonensis]
MKIFVADQFEFPDSCTEERVEIAVARRGAFPFAEVAAFVGARVSVDASHELGEPMPFQAVPAMAEVSSHLLMLAGITIPAACAWRVWRIRSGVDEVELVIEAPEAFMHYKWSSSA